jgi:hypothetical protein
MKDFACFYETAYLKILSVTLFRGTEAAILTLKMHTGTSGSHLWSCKITLKAACGK